MRLSVSCVAVLTVVLRSTVATAQPSTNSSANWVIAGPIHAVARSGNTIYVGGHFNGVSPKTQQIGAFGTFHDVVGRRGCPFPQASGISGSVTAIASDSAGGFYVAGRFDRVHGTDRHNIVHFNINCAIDMNWSATVRGRVNAMSVLGEVLYLGGLFTQAGQQGGGLAARSNLAAFHVGSGVLQTWNPGSDGEVHALKAVAYSSGTTNNTNIIIGGSFTQLAGVPRQRLGVVNAAGSATSFVADADASVLALELEPVFSVPPRLWVGGEFTTIGGVSRARLALVAITTGAVDTSFDAGANGHVRALAWTGSSSNTTLYVGGDFTQIGGTARNFVAAISNAGVALPFAPNPDGPVYALLPDAFNPTSVYIGGRFTQLSGVTRLNAARVHPTTAAAMEWNPAFNGEVRAFVLVSDGATGGRRVGVGGDFDAISAQRRRNLAAINLDTGQLLAWRPLVNDAVRALTIRNDVLYAGGDFTQIDGQGRSRLAAFNLTTQALNSWDPNANGPVRSLIWTGDTVFAGGDFTTIGGSGRVRVAGIHATTGATSNWMAPSFDATVRTLALQNTTLYVGGSFTAVGGAPTPYLVRVDSSTGAHDLAWAPAPNGEVRALCVEPNLVYAGGAFTMVGATLRSNLAALSTATATATSWQPDPNDAVNALSCSEQLIYAGGAFSTVGTGAAQQSRPRLAGLFPTATGATATYATSFRARNLGIVHAVLQGFDGVLTGGTGDPPADEDESVARLAFFPHNFSGVPGAPLSPRSLGAQLRWTAPVRGPRPAGYLLEAGTGPGLTNLSGGFPINATHFNPGFIPPGTYYVRLRAMNSLGVGPASEELVFTISGPFAGIGLICLAPPDPPQDFVASVTGSLVTFSWAPGSGELTTGFRLEAGGAPGSAEFVAPFGATTFSFAADAPPGVFYARIKGVGPCGTSTASAEATLVTGGVAAPPSAPRNFTGSVGASNTVTLTWAPPASGTSASYRLDVGTGPGLSNLASVILGGTSVSFANVPSGTYYLRLYAIGSTGIGPPSDELILIVP